MRIDMLTASLRHGRGELGVGEAYKDHDDAAKQKSQHCAGAAGALDPVAG